MLIEVPMKIKEYLIIMKNWFKEHDWILLSLGIVIFISGTVFLIIWNGSTYNIEYNQQIIEHINTMTWWNILIYEILIIFISTSFWIESIKFRKL